MSTEPVLYDVAVIGSGPGGYVAAIKGSQLGLKVALVEKYGKFGGTCLHWGCIPTKALLLNADLYEKALNGKEFGILYRDLNLDFRLVKARKDKVVRKLAMGTDFLMKKNKITTVRGKATLATPGVIGIEGETASELRARNIVIATGSEAKGLPGLEVDGSTVLTNKEILDLEGIPKSLVIIGAGAVGVEFASMYHDLGVKVTLLEYLPSLVPLEDREVGKELERSFKRRGVTVITNARFDATKVSREDGGVCIMAGPEGQEQQEVRAEVLLVAVGRAPITDDVGLETTRAKTDQRGFVQTDPFMRTAEPHLFAIGDIVPSYGLAHVAAHEGIVAVERIVEADPQPIDYTQMPRVTFCRPQIATLGLSEEECAQQGIDVKVGKFPFLANSKALITGEYEGWAKVIARKSDDVDLGVHMIGPHVTDVISEASVAKLLEASAWEVGSAVHPHPTLSETVGMAAEAFEGTITDLYLPKRRR